MHLRGGVKVFLELNGKRRSIIAIEFNRSYPDDPAIFHVHEHRSGIGIVNISLNSSTDVYTIFRPIVNNKLRVSMNQVVSSSVHPC